MTSRNFFKLIVLLATLVYLPHSLAQDTPQWHLPEGVKARIGKGSVNDIALSPDKKQLAVATGIGIWIYTVSTGGEVALLTGHTGYVRSVAYAPDGKTLVSASHGEVRLWNSTTQKHIETFEHQAGNSLEYSPDGKTLAVGGWGRIDLLNARTGDLKHTLSGYDGYVEFLAFSSDSNTLASATNSDEDPTIRLWNTRTGNQKQTLSGHTDRIRALVFSPTQNALVSGSYDYTIRFWNAGNGQNTKTLDGWWIDSLAYFPDGSKIAAGSEEISLLNVNTNQIQRTFSGHTRGVDHIVFSSDGSLLVSASWDGTIRLWNAQTGDHRLTLEGHFYINSSALSPNGKTLATTGSDGIFLWSALTGKFQQAFDVGHNSNTVAYLPHGGTLALEDWDGGPQIHLVNAKTGGIRRTLRFDGDSVRQIVFSPDENTMAGGSWDGTIRLWNTKNWGIQRTLSEHTGSISALAFSPDSRLLVSGSWDPDDSRVRLWNRNTGKLQRTLPGPGAVDSLAFSPNGSRLAVGGWEGIQLWNPENGQLQHNLRNSIGDVLAYSPDGKMLAAGGYREIQLWNPQNGQFQRSISGVPEGVNWLAFLPDGKTLISWDWSGTILLWNLNALPKILAEDVNRDGIVDVEDLVTVASSFGKPVAKGAYPNLDINADSVVDRKDILAIIRLLEAGAGAPSKVPVLTAENLQHYIDAAKRINDTSPAFQDGIRVLEQLLATLRTSVAMPRETAVFANYPNPFNPETWIPYQLEKDAEVVLTIYAVNGQLICTLALGHQTAGIYQTRSRAAYWDGRNEVGEKVASGVYFYTLTAGEFTATRKMLIRK